MIKVNICGVDFKNPVIAASGTFGFGVEMDEFFPIEKLGGICSKGLTLDKREGNRGRRIHETASGIMNSIGLQNPGVEGFIEEELPFMVNKNTVILANLGGGTVKDYIEGARLLNDTEVDFIELNISCPNIKEGGMAFGLKCEPARELVKATRGSTNKPIIVKLSPNAENIQEMAVACVEGGADGLSLVNTFNALAIDIYNRRPIFNNVRAGLSGPCIKPIALRMVHEVSQVVSVPIIGIGGIMTAEDAIEFIMAGASAIQVGSGNFIKQDLTLDIIKGIENFMIREGIESLEEIRGII